jgi:hypothetical protein
MEHYEAYCGRMRHHDPEAVAELIARSDPSAIIAFDALVDEFNAHRDEILAKGHDEVRKYVLRAREIVYQKGGK